MSVLQNRYTKRFNRVIPTTKISLLESMGVWITAISPLSNEMPSGKDNFDIESFYNKTILIIFFYVPYYLF